MSYNRDSLIRFYNKISELKQGFGWVSKRKLETVMNEWSREDSKKFTILHEAMRNLENIEKT